MKALSRVSIIIPAYNEEKRIVACLESIKKQTSPAYEVIVVDNNCTDNTVSLARAYPFVKIVKAKKQGIVFARNAGFDAATGDIIGRIDADITMPPQWVAHIQSFYKQAGREGTVWTGSGHFYNVRFPRLVSVTYMLVGFGLNRILLGHHMVWGSNMAFTRAQWQAVRSTVHARTGIHEDLDLAIHLHDAGYRITYDGSIKTNAHLARVRSDNEQLWNYLQWWPRTLKVHGRRTWVICWFFGALMMYLPARLLVFAEWCARLLGKPSLPE